MQVTTIAEVLQLLILIEPPTVQHPTKGCFLYGVNGRRKFGLGSQVLL